MPLRYYKYFSNVVQEIPNQINFHSYTWEFKNIKMVLYYKCYNNSRIVHKDSNLTPLAKIAV